MKHTTNFEILTSRTNFDDPQNIVIEADFIVDKARVEGNYKQQGKFLNAVINGKGKINITTGKHKSEGSF